MFQMHPGIAPWLENVLLDGEWTCGWARPEQNRPLEMPPALLRLFHLLGAHGSPLPTAPALLGLA